MPNRLASETSPYLLQHANNPVDWHPWGAEALERARREDRPILLSVGYAACHWCHVMERESFEDPETAHLMNELFVCVKVDREERPDLDGIYMQAVQAMTGRGGWPMTTFLTPAGEPFYAGTYFPPEDRHGIPSFKRVLAAVADAYRARPGDVQRTVERMRALYSASSERTRSAGRLQPQLLELAYRSLAQSYDARHGGFGRAPKFPHPMALDFLLRFWRRTGTRAALAIVRDSFRAMSRGGIYDHVGGGFHRYSVDDVWLVPHFEKMLYDNALLARLALHLHQATGDPEPRRIAEETIEWVEREMTAPDGGFHSTLDADSEGVEGKFYVWSAAEIDALLGDDAAAVRAYFGVSPEGTFEGSSILHVRADASAMASRLRIEESRLHAIVERTIRVLREARERRTRPGRDDKILAAWNGLMLRAIADAARILDRSDFRELAIRNADAVFERLVVDGRVKRVWAGGAARLQGYLEDHAALGLAALSLFELTHDATWVSRASELAASVVRWFWSDEVGAFFDTASDHETLVTRPREVTDNAMPSGTSLAVELLLRVAELERDEEARRRATWMLETLAEPMSKHALAFGHLLGSADLEINGAVEVAIAGATGEDGFRALELEVARHYLPALVLAGGDGKRSDVALLAGRERLDGRATAYVCRRYVCDAPVTEAATLGAQLEAAAGQRGDGPEE